MAYLAMLVFVEFVSHHPVIASQLPHFLHHSVAQQANVATRKALKAGNGLGGELVRLESAGSSGSRVGGPHRLEIDDQANVNAVNDGVEGLLSSATLHGDRVHHAHILSGGGTLQSGRRGGTEKRAYVSANVCTRATEQREIT